MESISQDERGKEGGEQMQTDHRQKEIRMDILAGGFCIEQNHRSDEDIAERCQEYATAIHLNEGREA